MRNSEHKKQVPIPYFTKETSNALKGIALILMFLHHFFTFPDSYVQGISYPELESAARWLCNSFNICVGLFAFLTGYFYAFAKEKNYRYSIRKILPFLLSYWLVYGIFAVIALICGKELTLKSAMLELFGLNRIVMVFCWYVPFYLIVMGLLPILAKMAVKNIGYCVTFMLVIPVVVCSVLSAFIQQSIISGMLRRTAEWFPCVGIGFLFGYYNLYQKLFDTVRKKLKPHFLRVLIDGVFVIGILVLRHYIDSINFLNISLGNFTLRIKVFLDAVYAPLFIYAAANLVNPFLQRGWLRALKEIGRHSMLMWFLHCLFFNVTADIFQPILFLPRDPLLVLFWGLLLCYGAAWLLKFVLDPITAWIDRKMSISLFYGRKK